MKVKEFVRFHLAPEQALKLLSDEINTFLKKDNTIVLIGISHATIELENVNANERFMASAIICYR